MLLSKNIRKLGIVIFHTGAQESQMWGQEKWRWGCDSPSFWKSSPSSSPICSDNNGLWYRAYARNLHNGVDNLVLLLLRNCPTIWTQNGELTYYDEGSRSQGSLKKSQGELTFMLAPRCCRPHSSTLAWGFWAPDSWISARWVPHFIVIALVFVLSVLSFPTACCRKFR